MTQEDPYHTFRAVPDKPGADYTPWRIDKFKGRKFIRTICKLSTELAAKELSEHLNILEKQRAQELTKSRSA